MHAFLLSVRDNANYSMCSWFNDWKTLDFLLEVGST